MFQSLMVPFNVLFTDRSQHKSMDASFKIPGWDPNLVSACSRQDRSVPKK